MTAALEREGARWLLPALPVADEGEPMIATSNGASRPLRRPLEIPPTLASLLSGRCEVSEDTAMSRKRPGSDGVDGKEGSKRARVLPSKQDTGQLNFAIETQLARIDEILHSLLKRIVEFLSTISKTAGPAPMAEAASLESSDPARSTTHDSSVLPHGRNRNGQVVDFRPIEALLQDFRTWCDEVGDKFHFRSG
ncbi:hypothetical protein BDW66DRAFT_149694 [Aspergillus desertorum]